MAEFETTTRKGRVVYSRRKHYFSLRDVKRIWSSIKKTTDPDNGYSGEDIKIMQEMTKDFMELVYPRYAMIRKEMIPIEERTEIKTFISNTTIELMIEIIEKIPFIPQRLERTIAEFIYWNMIAFLDSILLK